DGGEQNDALDDVLHLVVDVHDGEGIEQDADQDAADHHAQPGAAAADQADAADHHHQHHVVEHRALNDLHLHAAGGADPDEARDPGEQGDQDMLEHDQGPERDAGQPRGFRIVALGIDETAVRGFRQEQVQQNGNTGKHEDRHGHSEQLSAA